jgi:hypothetical protein
LACRNTLIEKTEYLLYDSGEIAVAHVEAVSFDAGLVYPR